jgi:hypothetical protein
MAQIEIYFSILARKALTPCHFTDVDELAGRILGFQAQFANSATPFHWTFTRHDLHALWTDSISAARSHRPPERTSVSRY